MNFQIVKAVETTEIRLEGRLTYDDHIKFNEIKIVAGDVPSRKIILDLSALEFIDSAGLGMLVIFEDAASVVNSEVTIRGAHGIVRKLMDLINFGELIRLVD
ncbi:MAG: STAS domain-containing protein [Rhodospirillaceae bacterium]